MNEIVSNAFKHAFPESRKGKILIRAEKKDSEIRLEIRDNGIGLPENPAGTTHSIGLRLIQALAHQLDAQIQVIRDQGTTYIITFPQEET